MPKLFERKKLPQVVDIRHIGIESMERLEPANILPVTLWLQAFPAAAEMSIAGARSSEDGEEDETNNRIDLPSGTGPVRQHSTRAVPG